MLELARIESDKIAGGRTWSGSAAEGLVLGLAIATAVKVEGGKVYVRIDET